MEVIDCSILEFPVFMYSTKGRYFYSQSKEGFGHATRLGLEGLKSEGLDILDSGGRHFKFLEVNHKKIVFSDVISIICFNPRYKADFSFIKESELNLKSFKKNVLDVLKSNRCSLDSSGNSDEIIQQVEQAESYREIIEMFF